MQFPAFLSCWEYYASKKSLLQLLLTLSMISKAETKKKLIWANLKNFLLTFFIYY